MASKKTAKPAAKKPVVEPAKKKAAPERDAHEAAAYDQGRHARKVAIAREQPPYGKSDNLRAHWEAGWDFEDGTRG